MAAGGMTYRGLGGLGDLLGAGLRALSRYTGTLFAVFVVQSLVAATCMIGVALVLAQTFSRLPMFDEAVDGDLVAMIWVVRHAPVTFLAIGGVVFTALLLWQVVAWFVAGGLYGVLAERPEGRADTARTFGARGTATYLAYARLAIVALPGYTLVLAVFGATLRAVGPRLEYALSVSELVGTLALVVVPTALLAHVFFTVTDYARVELTLRGDTHAPGVLVTYLRTLGYVLRRPLTLVHGAVGWVLIGLVTLAYAYLAHGHPMYGAEGAVMLFLVRQGVALLRLAIRVAVMGGQLELGRTRPLPPRRAEPATDARARDA